jgi:hypothetical protein
MTMEYSTHMYPAQSITRVSSRPTFSIVLASVESRTIVEACVTALLSRCEGAEAEVIVVRAEGAPLMASSSRHRSRVRFVTAPADCSTQELRSYGMRAAHGDIVLLMEDAPGMELQVIERTVALATRRSGAFDHATEMRGPSFEHGAPVRSHEPHDAAQPLVSADQRGSDQIAVGAL